jgi:putative FmdB family regulatory protein
VPVYEYRCDSGHHYEKSEGFDAPREQACLKCGAIATRQISLPAVIFKGSGFYSTDNRKSDGDNGRSSETEPLSTSSDGHGHSHDGDGDQSHSTDGGSKVEAAATD